MMTGGIREAQISIRSDTWHVSLAPLQDPITPSP